MLLRAVTNHWTGLVQWTTGMDYWNGLLEWTIGIDYWTDLFAFSLTYCLPS